MGLSSVWAQGESLVRMRSTEHVFFCGVVCCRVLPIPLAAQYKWTHIFSLRYEFDAHVGRELTKSSTLSWLLALCLTCSLCGIHIVGGGEADVRCELCPRGPSACAPLMPQNIHRKFGPQNLLVVRVQISQQDLAAGLKSKQQPQRQHQGQPTAVCLRGITRGQLSQPFWCDRPVGRLFVRPYAIQIPDAIDSSLLRAPLR